MSQPINESHDFQGTARILNLPAPGSSTEPARKTDLDAAVATLNAALAGFSFIDVTPRVAVTTNVTVANPGTATFDSVALSGGDVLFLTGQSTPSQNGLYVFNSSSTPLTRATVGGVALVYKAGSVVAVGPDGTLNKNSLWLQQTDNPVVGTTALTFTQFGSTYSAGTGITLTGTVFSLTSPVAIGNGGTNAVTAATARSNLGAPGVYNGTFGDGASASFAINHALGNAYPLVQIYNTSTGAKEDCAVVTTDANHVTLSAEAWTASPPGVGAYKVIVVG